MRAEDIAGVSFFALLATGIVVAILGARRSLTARQRALWLCWGLGLISASSIGFGLANFELIHNSPKPVVEGNLWDIREFFSSKEHSTRFRITVATGQAVQIWCSYTGPGLMEGERARVRYVEYNGKLEDLDMLTGPYQVWHLHESSGENGYLGWVAIGLACGFFAYRQWAKMRQEQMGAQ